MQAFFLSAGEGERFCVHHPPLGGTAEVGVVFVHAFAEEMNRSRHIVAQAARRLASQGIGVLLVDLRGCGDSSGLLDEVRWDDWGDDLRRALRWMRERGYRRLWLWGMRLGAPLVAGCAAQPGAGIERCIVWQPVARGDAHLTQFLRLRGANALIAGEVAADAGESPKALRARLAAGEVVEVAGYPLAPELAGAIDASDLARHVPACPVHWFEIVPEADRPPSQASARVIAAWQQAGVAVDTTLLPAEPFWGASNGAEHVQCPAIVEATAQAARAWR